jgi:hypothetical protein
VWVHVSSEAFRGQQHRATEGTKPRAVELESLHGDLEYYYSKGDRPGFGRMNQRKNPPKTVVSIFRAAFSSLILRQMAFLELAGQTRALESEQAAGRGVKRVRNSADLAAPGKSVVRDFLQRLARNTAENSTSS